MTLDVNRRRFVGTAVASSVFTIVPRHVLGGAGFVAPNQKITLAHIGMGSQGFNELGGLLEDPAIQIVAVCDPNKDSNDYVEWGKGSVRNKIRNYLGDPNWREHDRGCPGGREVGRQAIDAHYARQRGSDNFKACTAYADFRELLEEEKDVDAVKIMTPDHLHATIAVAAMKRGKHVMVHKPLGNRMNEGRLVVETARQTKTVTQLLAYGSGSGNALIAECVKQGVIGELREIHNWTNRPVWPQYTEIPVDKPPVPKGLDWDLWLGPAVDRPYHPHYTHTVFRGWYDFGGGSMADMGIYSLWPIFRTLDLGVPTSARAWTSHTCAIVDQVSRPVKNDFSYPAACSIRFEFPEQGTVPGLNLFWYDGGMKPRLPDELETHDVEMAREGILFVGDGGSILGGFHGQNPQLFVGGKVEPLRLDGISSPLANGLDGPRHSPWVKAIHDGNVSPGSFTHAGPITDTVNLGTVAIRAQKKVIFDSQEMKITNDGNANRHLAREYRQGWEL